MLGCVRRQMLERHMAYFIGIDAGGTKTTAALADETGILAKATTGTLNLVRIDAAEADRALASLLHTLSSDSGISLKQITRVCLGFAGSRVPKNIAWANAAFEKATGSLPIIVEDAEIALEAAFRGGPGVLVISGTGSHVMARRDDGAMVHVGGYGRLFSDEGSGEWIGQQAVRRAMSDHDFQSVSPLLQRLMDEWHCRTFNDVIAAANETPVPNFSQLVPMICELADQGDKVANAILADAGQELARLVKTALSRLQTALLPVACVGSILEQIPTVRMAMRDTLPGITVLETAVDPIQGALWLAQTAN